MKAFVFGGTGTIGKEVVRRFIRDGYGEVAFTYNTNAAEAEFLTREFGDRVRPVNYVQFKKFISRSNAIVDAIGINIPAGIKDVTYNEIAQVVTVNTIDMLDRLKTSLNDVVWGGSITIIGSSSAVTGGPKSVHYAASKASISAAVKGAAIEVGVYGIRVNELQIGYVVSQMAASETARRMVKERTCLQKFIDPEDVAAAVSFLASDDAKYITAATIRLDGGGLW